MRSSRSGMLAAVVLTASLALACGDGNGGTGERPAEGGPTPPPSEPAGDGFEETVPPEARAEAKQIFATNCATCHGEEGRGNGPGASALAVQPRNFHDPEWQRSTSDERIEKVIVYGGAVVGLSPAMAANPQLSSKPQVVAALREHVRSFAPEGSGEASPSGTSGPEASPSGGR